MRKISIFRRIELIHAAKCNKAKSFLTSVSSCNTIGEIRSLIEKNQTHDFQIINDKIVAWQNQVPIVADYDIYNRCDIK